MVSKSDKSINFINIIPLPDLFIIIIDFWGKGNSKNPVRGFLLGFLLGYNKAFFAGFFDGSVTLDYCGATIG